MNSEVDPTKEIPKNKIDPIICNFCGMNNNEVMKMIAGPGVCICDKCVYLCVNILEEK